MNANEAAVNAWARLQTALNAERGNAINDAGTVLGELVEQLLTRRPGLAPDLELIERLITLHTRQKVLTDVTIPAVERAREARFRSRAPVPTGPRR